MKTRFAPTARSIAPPIPDPAALLALHLPVGEVAVGGDLVGAEDGDVDPAAADQRERVDVMDDRRARLQRDVLRAGIHEMKILLARPRQRAVADHPVLGVKDDPARPEIGIGAERGDPDAEIDDPAVAEFPRQPVAHLLAREALRDRFAHRRGSGRGGHQPSGGGGILTIRWTRMPGVWT
jgi:hypothetical protein